MTDETQPLVVGTVAKLDPKTPELAMLMFLCPAPCCGLHAVPVHPHGAAHIQNDPLKRWGWNGSLDAPTLDPSIRVSWDRNDETKQWQKCCHSQVTNGQIGFYPDSTHAMAGHTVAIPNVTEW